MSERNENRRDGSDGEVFGRAKQVLARHDDGGFAPEFNHFRDGRARPTP